MTWLFNLAYGIAIVLASPWLLYRMVVHGKYRDGWAEKFCGYLPERRTGRPCVWLHAVSVGEVNAIVPLTEEILRRRPDCQCVITTTTTTGHAVAKRRLAGHTVCYAPLDFSWAIRNALRRIRPDGIVLAELELWPNWIRIAHRMSVPVVVVNGRLSDRSFRGYHRWKRWLGPMFQSLTAVGAQTDEYAARFRELGVATGRVVTTGSIKFDGAASDRRSAETQHLAQWAGIEPHETIMLAGSTQAPEEALAIESFRRMRNQFPGLRLILVPRHPERFEEVARLLDAAGLPWARRSRDASGRQPIILVDTMGELSHWWGVAHIGYVGGSMGRREGQNMIEPAAYGVAVSFGPRTRNFRDVVALLLERQAAVVVHDGEELTEFVSRCLCDPAWRASLGRRAQETVRSQVGAVGRTVDLLEQHWACNKARADRAA